MRNLVIFLSFIPIIIFTACSSTNKSEEIASYNYTEKSTGQEKEWQNKIGNWIEKGTECYGLVVAVNANDVPQRGKPVKAKILRISENEIKMKALENVNIARTKDCSNMGISKGETWLERDNELFKTKEEALAYLKTKGLLMEE